MRQRACVLLFLLHLFAKAQAQEIVADTVTCCEKACFECCRPDAYAPAGVMIDHVHPKGEFSIAYGAMFMNMHGNMQGAKAISDQALFTSYLMAPHNMNMQMHMLMPMYGITNRLTVMGMFSFTKNVMSMHMQPVESMSNMPGMNTSNMPSSVTTAGCGDSRLYFLYNLLGNCLHRLVISGGVSLPTGNIAVKGPTLQSEQDILPYSMQLGSGTYDLLPGLVYVGQTDRFSFGAALNGSIRTGINARNYRLGNEYVFSPWIAYKIVGWGSFSLRAEGYGQQAMKDYDPQINQSSLNDPSANSLNSGRTKISLLGGLNFYLTGRHMNDTRVLLEGGLPLGQNVNGVQMSSKAIINLRVQYSFIKN